MTILNPFEIALRNAQAQLPDRSIGRLLEMSATIITGTLRQRSSGVDDDQLRRGLLALIPDDDEEEWIAIQKANRVDLKARSKENE